MKQYQIINAYKNLEALSENERLTDFDQWNIYKLRKILKPHIEFQAERENALLDKYRQYANDKGILEGEAMQNYIKDLQELSQLDAEIEQFTKPKIKITQDIIVGK